MEPKFIPSVGRDVHFLSSDGRGGLHSEAAKIVAVNDLETGTVNLVVWSATGTSRSQTSVLPGDGPNRWQVPPRVGG